MTTEGSNDNNESSYDAAQFRAFMKSMGGKVVERMGTARDLASVSVALFRFSLHIRFTTYFLDDACN